MSDIRMWKDRFFSVMYSMKTKGCLWITGYMLTEGVSQRISSTSYNYKRSPKVKRVQVLLLFFQKNQLD